MAPDGGVGDVAAEQAVDRWGGEELHAFAAVVPAGEAGFAAVADEARFDGHAVAYFEVSDGGVGGEDYARGFMAEDMGFLDDHGADAAGVPEVDVGTVEKSRFGDLVIDGSIENRKEAEFANGQGKRTARREERGRTRRYQCS